MHLRFILKSLLCKQEYTTAPLLCICLCLFLFLFLRINNKSYHFKIEQKNFLREIYIFFSPVQARENHNWYCSTMVCTRILISQQEPTMLHFGRYFQSSYANFIIIITFLFLLAAHILMSINVFHLLIFVAGSSIFWC